jgi:hypothetical protein
MEKEKWIWYVPPTRFTINHPNRSKTQKDLPIQLLSSSKPLSATLLLASFGTSQGYDSHVFNLEIKTDPNVPLPKYEKPLRYGKLAEIHHIFKPDPKSGPKIVSLFFVLAVLATVPILLGAVCYSVLSGRRCTDLCSGRTLELTSLISRRPLPPHRLHIVFSLGPSYRWRAFFSYTTTTGHFSDSFPRLVLLDW